MTSVRKPSIVVTSVRPSAWTSGLVRSARGTACSRSPSTSSMRARTSSTRSRSRSSWARSVASKRSCCACKPSRASRAKSSTSSVAPQPAASAASTREAASSARMGTDGARARDGANVGPHLRAPVALRAAMQAEAVQVLQQLLRFNTVNPPGAEGAAQEYLAGLLRAAGLEVTLAGPDPERPNLVARLRGRAPGPVLGLLSHVDTVGADPEGWRHDPWSGALDEGCVWGRGALDMKSQTAAEAVAAATLARSGWRPARGDLLVISVMDEEVDGTGAIWLCQHEPELARCDYLLNEGAGESFSVGDGRVYTVSVGEKGVFRFTVTTDGAAGHASMPMIADNALLKL